MLPEANYRASMLWKDIRTKRPGFDLQPGVFYSGIDNYSILVAIGPRAPISCSTSPSTTTPTGAASRR